MFLTAAGHKEDWCLVLPICLLFPIYTPWLVAYEASVDSIIHVRGCSHLLINALFTSLHVNIQVCYDVQGKTHTEEDL
jgi:hypothetical protein